MYGGKEFQGRITGFTMEASASRTLSLLPPQNATGNFAVKIVQHLPVRVEVDRPTTRTRFAFLFVGLSVGPFVYYKGRPPGLHAPARSCIRWLPFRPEPRSSDEW